MTENERFSITTDEDNLIRIECDVEILTPYEVVGLLNKQHEENKQLKQKEIDFLEKRYAEVCYLKNKIEGLEKENEQLKKEISQLRHWNKCLAKKRHQKLPYHNYNDCERKKRN